jgi:hypothetical protein
MDYQLIFQFPETFFESIEEVFSFENRLLESMPNTCHVDGHDIGSGTVNFFVYTNAPLSAHKVFRKYLGTNKRAWNAGGAHHE